MDNRFSSYAVEVLLRSLLNGKRNIAIIDEQQVIKDPEGYMDKDICACNIIFGI